MATETIMIRVSPEAEQEHRSLEDIMRDISRKAPARGLRPEILESILLPYHEAWQALFDSLDQFYAGTRAAEPAAARTFG